MALVLCWWPEAEAGGGHSQPFGSALRAGLRSAAWGGARPRCHPLRQPQLSRDICVQRRLFF